MKPSSIVSTAVRKRSSDCLRATFPASSSVTSLKTATAPIGELSGSSISGTALTSSHRCSPSGRCDRQEEATHGSAGRGGRRRSGARRSRAADRRHRRQPTGGPWTCRPSIAAASRPRISSAAGFAYAICPLASWTTRPSPSASARRAGCRRWLLESSRDRDSFEHRGLHAATGELAEEARPGRRSRRARARPAYASRSSTAGSSPPSRAVVTASTVPAATAGRSITPYTTVSRTRPRQPHTSTCAPPHPSSTARRRRSASAALRGGASPTRTVARPQARDGVAQAARRPAPPTRIRGHRPDRGTTPARARGAGACATCSSSHSTGGSRARGEARRRTRSRQHRLARRAPRRPGRASRPRAAPARRRGPAPVRSRRRRGRRCSRASASRPSSAAMPSRSSAMAAVGTPASMARRAMSAPGARRNRHRDRVDAVGKRSIDAPPSSRSGRRRQPARRPSPARGRPRAAR